MQRSFTCCVGTGMENHALHGLGLYYQAGDRLFVNVYAPSTAHWEQAGVRLTMATDFPAGDRATLTLDVREPRTLTLLMRRPSWAAGGFAIQVNGDVVQPLPPPGSYVELHRAWNSGDTVRVAMPKALRLARLNDNPHRAAVMLGPLVLAGDLGPAPRRRTEGDGDGTTAEAPEPAVLVTNRPVNDWLKPVDGKPLVYHAQGIARRPSDDAAFDVDFLPFHEIHRRTYAAYWDVLTPAEYTGRRAEVATERARQRSLEAATVAHVAAGDPEKEKAFNLQGEESTVVRADGRPGRRSARWFSYELPIDPGHATTIVVTYNSDNRRLRSFEILADGKRIGVEELPQSSVSKFVDIAYPLPPELARDKQRIVIRFQATDGNEIAPVFSVRSTRTG
jgi:hypothetical protein